MSGVKRITLGAGCMLLLMVSSFCGCNRTKGPIPPFAAPSAGGAVSLPGKWLVQFTQPNGFDISFCLIEITEKESQPSVEVVARSHHFPKAELTKFELASPNVRLDFGGSDLHLIFRGHTGSSAIRGTVTIEGKEVLPARLVTTTLDTLEGNEEPFPAAGRDQLVQSRNTAQIASMMKTVPTSPLLLDAYRNIAMFAKQDARSAKDLERLVEEDLKCARSWGPELEAKVYMELGSALAQQHYQLPLAERLLSEATSRLNAESPASWSGTLASAWSSVGKPDQAIPLYRQVHEKFPWAPALTWEFAKALERSGDTEGALELFVELAIIPGQQAGLKQAFNNEEISVQSEVTHLWQDAKRSPSSYPAYAKEVYTKRMETFAKNIDVTHRETSGPLDRAALVEVFTGADCKGCIEVDTAAAALQTAFGPAELIVVEYHTHLKEPDVMANSDSAQRLQYYQSKEIPAFILNGVPHPEVVAGTDGQIGHVPPIAEFVRKLIEPIVAEPASASIRLSCNPENNILNIQADVEGLNELSGDLRLRLLLLEDEIDYAAPNDLLVHHSVLRAMPGGAQGVAPANGKLAYKGQFSLPKLRRELDSEIVMAQQSAKKQFQGKPLQLKKLRLVALLQNDATKEVLQATSVPVTPGG